LLEQLVRHALLRPDMHVTSTYGPQFGPGAPSHALFANTTIDVQMFAMHIATVSVPRQFIRSVHIAALLYIGGQSAAVAQQSPSETQQVPSPFCMFLQKPPAHSSLRVQRSPFGLSVSHLPFGHCALLASALEPLEEPALELLEGVAFEAPLEDPAFDSLASFERVFGAAPADGGCCCIAAPIIALDPALGCTMQWPLICAVPGGQCASHATMQSAVAKDVRTTIQCDFEMTRATRPPDRSAAYQLLRATRNTTLLAVCRTRQALCNALSRTLAGAALGLDSRLAHRKRASGASPLLAGPVPLRIAQCRMSADLARQNDTAKIRLAVRG
jgi:hypothetical protein